MLELPESGTISRQAGRTLVNKRITKVVPATSAHKFAFYNGDPAGYVNLLTGKRITSARGHGMFVDICCDEDTRTRQWGLAGYPVQRRAASEAQKEHPVRRSQGRTVPQPEKDPQNHDGFGRPRYRKGSVWKIWTLQNPAFEKHGEQALSQMRRLHQ